MAWDDNLEIWSWAASPSPFRTYTGAWQIWEICSHDYPVFSSDFGRGWCDSWMACLMQKHCGWRALIPSDLVAEERHAFHRTIRGLGRHVPAPIRTIPLSFTMDFEASFSNFSGRASLSFLCPMLLYTFDFVCVQLAHIDTRGHS